MQQDLDEVFSQEGPERQDFKARAKTRYTGLAIQPLLQHYTHDAGLVVILMETCGKWTNLGAIHAKSIPSSRQEFHDTSVCAAVPTSQITLTPSSTLPAPLNFRCVCQEPHIGLLPARDLHKTSHKKSFGHPEKQLR